MQGNIALLLGWQVEGTIKIPLFSRQWKVHVAMNENMHIILLVGKPWWIKSLCKSKSTTGMIYDIRMYLHLVIVPIVLRTRFPHGKSYRLYYQRLLIQFMIEVMQANSPVRL